MSKADIIAIGVLLPMNVALLCVIHETFGIRRFFNELLPEYIVEKLNEAQQRLEGNGS